MRIIGGKFRGRKLVTPEGRGVRPTSDRLRERLMNILIHRRRGGLQGADVVDLFAGSGAFGLECLSRGAARVTFVDNDPVATALIRRNAEMLGVDEQVRILQIDATALPPRDTPADLLFADPPYSAGLAGPALERARLQGWIGTGTIVAVETARDEELALDTSFTLCDRREQARSALNIFVMDAAQPVRH